MNIKELEKSLWNAADNLRANSKLTATQYTMPVLGLIFLRHAYNKFQIAKEELSKESTGSSRRKTDDGDISVLKSRYSTKGAMYLREESQYSYLCNLSESEDLGSKINTAMEIVAEDYTQLKGILPQNYNIFDNSLLSELLRVFNGQELNHIKGDLFGKIYEYFLSEFAKSGAQEGGEFFTPESLVQLIVNFIEPDHGIVFDPACGSGGMFVQTGHFIESHHLDKSKVATFYGQEKADLNIGLAKMNLAVHGIEGKLQQGNTFYEDKNDLLGKCDFVMANPPFNVDGVIYDTIKNDPRLLEVIEMDKKGNEVRKRLTPSVNKDSKISNANYLWVQYFLTYLNDEGRAGFVMASSSTDSGGNDKLIRENILKQGAVDVMVTIGNNFFYTLTLPCVLWFFDKNKKESIRDKVLMLDAREIHTRIEGTQNKNTFSPEQMKNLTAIVHLYRGEAEKYQELIHGYVDGITKIANNLQDLMKNYKEKEIAIIQKISYFLEDKSNDEPFKKVKDIFQEACQDIKTYEELIKEFKTMELSPKENNFVEFLENSGEKIEKIIRFEKALDGSYKNLYSAWEIIDKNIDTSKDPRWQTRDMRGLSKELSELRKIELKEIKKTNYYFKQIKWLVEKFGNGKISDVLGLCKVVDIDEIEKNDYSLNPGRYVGVAEKVDDDVDFEERMKEIHIELQALNEEAKTLAEEIAINFEELGI